MLKTLLYAQLFLVCLGIGYLIIFITQNLPGLHGVIHVNRSSGNGTVYRLLDGIPHAHADSLDMGYYTLGFAMSTDRIFQMDKLRRLAQGRLSEILGEPAISIDKVMRNYGFEHVAKMVYMHLDNRTKSLIQDFCDGINDYPHYFSEGIEYWVLGTQFDKWNPEDTLSVYVFMQYALSESNENFRDFLFSKIQDEDIVEKILPMHPDDEIDQSTSVFTDEELKEFGLYKKDGIKRKLKEEKRKLFEFFEDNLEEELQMVEEIQKLYSPGSGASNCWAVSGEHTKSGKPMLSNDPHLDPSMPSPFYMAELNINDEYVIGALLPGIPLFISGRTNDIAFGVTSLNADIIDFFEEKVEGDKYLYKGEWEDLEIREEVINVKDGNPVTILVRSTRHGPILDHVGTLLGTIDSAYPHVKNKATISMAWAGYHFENSFINDFIDILKFKNIHQVADSIKNKNGGSFGLCVADNSGNIGFLPHVRFPKREDVFAGERGVKPGWTGEYDWQGFVDSSKYPFQINPKKGYVFSANGRTSSLNVEAGMGVPMASTGRAIRINMLLDDLINVQKKKLDIDDFKTMMNDTYDVFAALKTPLMISIVEQNNHLEKYLKDKTRLPQIKKWIEQLKSWNYRFDKELTQPTLFSLWEIFFFNNLFKRQITNDKLRNFISKKYGFDDFIVKLYSDLKKDPSHFSKYCQSGQKDQPNACVKALVDGLDFIHEYLVPAGTTFSDEDALYGKWHTVEYNYAPFTKSFLRYFFDRTDSDNGSKNTINVGSIYYQDFKEKGLQSSHTPNYRMVVDFGKDEDNQFSIETGCSENILGKYFYYNLHDRHMSIELTPMNFNSLNTTHTKRYSTIRFIYKVWYDQEEERLRLLEEAKLNSTKADDQKNEDL